MDQKSLDQFKKILQARLIELQRSTLQARHEGRIVESNDSKDEGDRAVSSLTKDMLFRQSSQNAAMLNAIKSALGRIENTTFGLCLNCEQEINLSRLKALPWVRYCITCQELMEEQK